MTERGQWEYHVWLAERGYHSKEKKGEVLNNLGAEGWELVAAFSWPVKDTEEFVFKRKKTPY